MRGLFLFVIACLSLSQASFASTSPSNCPELMVGIGHVQPPENRLAIPGVAELLRPVRGNRDSHVEIEFRYRAWEAEAKAPHRQPTPDRLLWWNQYLHTYYRAHRNHYLQHVPLYENLFGTQLQRIEKLGLLLRESRTQGLSFFTFGVEGPEAQLHAMIKQIPEIEAIYSPRWRPPARRYGARKP